MSAGLASHRGLLRIDAALGVPLVAVGASAGAYYPAIARRLNTEPVIPRWSDVANAVGAVVGNVRMVERAEVTPLKKGRFRAHVDMSDHDSPEQAMVHTETVLTETVMGRASDEGAATVDTSTERDEVWATVSGERFFVECTVTATATGRPELGNR